MATRKRLDPKKPALGKPADRRPAIRRAAKRAGIEPKPETKPPALALSFTPECMAWCKEAGLPLDPLSLKQWEAKQLAARPMTFTFGELAGAIGYEVKAEDFAATALEAIAQEIENVADCAEASAGMHIWRHFNNIAGRAEFAAKIQRQLTGGES